VSVLLDVAPLPHCFVVAPQRQRQDLPRPGEALEVLDRDAPWNITAIISFLGFQTTYNALPDDFLQLG